MDQTPQTNEAPTHTPGPWTFKGEHFKHDDSAIIKGADGKHVAAALDFNRYDREKEVEANAHLIAAAPDLLAAARRASDVLNRWQDFRPSERSAAFDDLDAAIAKATGGITIAEELDRR